MCRPRNTHVKKFEPWSIQVTWFVLAWFSSRLLSDWVTASDATTATRLITSLVRNSGIPPTTSMQNLKQTAEMFLTLNIASKWLESMMENLAPSVSAPREIGELTANTFNGLETKENTGLVFTLAQPTIVMGRFICPLTNLYLQSYCWSLIVWINRPWFTILSARQCCLHGW